MMKQVGMNGQGKEKGAEGWEWGTYRRSVRRQRGSFNLLRPKSSPAADA
jgi:hypothetical protein